MVTKIISGGQTGVDQAALDTAIKLNIPHGGWIPKGRKTEDGVLPEKYQLQEMSTTSYPKRTEKNILDSEGTLIFSRGKLTGGSALTRKLEKQHQKPWVHIDLDKQSKTEAVSRISKWIKNHDIQVLNVAGPRESKNPGIHDEVMEIFENILMKKQTAMKPLPCPFCGAAPVINSYVIKGVKFWNVGCENDDCAVDVETADFESEDEAVMAWNKRAD